MSLDLDKRQLAMLREMGVRVWQPPAAQPQAAVPGAAAVALIEAPAEKPVAASAPMASAATPKPAPVTEAVMPASAAFRSLGTPSAEGATWQLGSVQTLYAAQTAAAARPLAGHTRWLLLLESADARATDPLGGDAGKLLDNMLRAAQRPNCGQPTYCAALARNGGAGEAEGGALQPALAQALAQTQPDVVLIMGRLAAQAVLGSNEPLGKLRGQVHQVLGTPAVVTYDASYLLRSLPDKAKAWDDLCRAMALASKA
jgi:uracil-DNA glycosylase family 4